VVLIYRQDAGQLPLVILLPPMRQSGFFNWNLTLVIVQLHRWEGTTRNLAFLLSLVVVVLEEGEA
jgi:hypothetical protein